MALEDAFTRLQLSEQHFRALAEALPQIVWTADPDGSVDWFNARWYDYTGTHPGEGLGWEWKNCCDSNDLIDVLEKWQSALHSGTVYENELRIRSRDGDYRWFLVRAWPLADSNETTIRWFGSNTDVHDLKLAEQKLHRENMEIELANRVLSVFLEASGDQLFDEGLRIVMEALKSQHGVFGYIDEKGDLYLSKHDAPHGGMRGAGQMHSLSENEVERVVEPGADHKKIDILERSLRCTTRPSPDH